MAKILIVDDEANIRSSLQKILSEEGYTVATAANGKAALDYVSSQQFDLALVDLRLPDMSGIDVLTTLRQQSPETINIILTAHASLGTAIEALRQGAHDYLFKPCDPEELRASVRRGLSRRRSQMAPEDLLDQLEYLSRSLNDFRDSIISPEASLAQSTAEPSTRMHGQRFLEKNGLIVDFLEHVASLDGQQLSLTPTQFEILAYLVKQAPRAVPPQELIRQVLGYDGERWEASEIVRQHIHQLRRKIKEKTGQTGIIRTVRGVGYAIGAKATS